VFGRWISWWQWLTEIDQDRAGGDRDAFRPTATLSFLHAVANTAHGSRSFRFFFFCFSFFIFFSPSRQRENERAFARHILLEGGRCPNLHRLIFFLKRAYPSPLRLAQLFFLTVSRFLGKTAYEIAHNKLRVSPRRSSQQFFFSSISFFGPCSERITFFRPPSKQARTTHARARNNDFIPFGVSSPPAVVS